MTERERLIELLKVPIYPRIGADPAEVVADYLLDHGVIVPPCKVGDTVYSTAYGLEYGNGEVILPCQVYRISVSTTASARTETEISTVVGGYGTRYLVYESSFGKTVFLTREEAEEALKAREKDADA